MNIVKNKILKYCEENSEKNSSILDDLTNYTQNNIEGSAMISGPQVGNVLQGIIKILNAKNILEIGMYTGFSAIKMAEAIPNDGEIHTCELAKNHCITAQSFFNKTSHGNKIIIHQGEALSLIEKFSINTFDMAFIDADKINYPNYYHRCMVLVRSGGVIILDNMLWGGTVLNPKDDDAIAIRDTGKLIQSDKRCFNFLLPIRDGLMVCYKK